MRRNRRINILKKTKRRKTVIKDDKKITYELEYYPILFPIAVMIAILLTVIAEF